MAEINKQVGARIRTLRSGRGLTLQKLAELAEMSEKHLGKVERGTANASIQCIEDVARALGLPISDILDAEHERPSVDLTAAIMSMLPKLEQKDLQAVYRLVKTLAQQ